jgi:xylitol oxidase
MDVRLRNWAGNYEYSATKLNHPQTLAAVQALVAQATTLKVLGSRHSFNAIADTTGQFISLDQYETPVTIQHEQRQVSIGAGINYGQLSEILHREGFALHNLASLPHISVVGACATATHGSGVRNKNLSAAVSSLEIVSATGDVVKLSRRDDGDTFAGAVVGLGGLGVVVGLTLDLLPAFDMRVDVFENLPTAELDAHFDKIMASAYSVSLFTDWQTDHIHEVWLKSQIGDAVVPFQPRTEFFGATAATQPLHPVAGLSPENCTEQLGKIGYWHTRLPHFRFDSTPSVGNELQSEYFVARADAVAALQAIRKLRQEISPHLLVTEIRTIAADNFWMSPCYQRDSVGIHFTWKMDWPAVRNLLPLIEAQLAPFDARPHWAKLFTMSPARVQSLYPKLPQFQELVRHFDPQGKFRNAFLEETLFGGN